MRASSPRKALVWPKCLFTPAITTAVSSWRSGAAAGDGVLAAMSAVAGAGIACGGPGRVKSEEHTSELQSLMRISYAGFCLKKKKKNIKQYERVYTTPKYLQ